MNFHNYTSVYTNSILMELGQAAPNIPFWHVDYLELKLLKKQQGHTDPPLSL